MRLAPPNNLLESLLDNLVTGILMRCRILCVEGAIDCAYLLLELPDLYFTLSAISSYKVDRGKTDIGLHTCLLY